MRDRTPSGIRKRVDRPSLDHSRTFREQVTTRTARTLREVSGAIFVAAEADGALRSRRIFVTAVAQVARLMFGLSMQPWELLHLVAAGARRHAGDSGGSVRAMAGLATGAQLAVGALLLGAVTIRAGLFDGQSS